MNPLDIYIGNAPWEVQDGVREFFPVAEWDNAARVSFLESGWNAFALDDSTDTDHPCGSTLRVVAGITVVAERSVGYFQINTCNFPGWEWQRLYNARHNCGTAHLIWTQFGWSAWYYSALQLGLIQPSLTPPPRRHSL